MKIADATVSMQSQHMAAMRQEQHANLRAWIGQQRPNFEGTRQGAQPQPPAPAQAPLVQISAAGKAAQAAAVDQTDNADDLDPYLQLIKSMVEWMTGKPVKLIHMSQVQSAPSAPVPDPSTVQAAAQAPARAGFGIEYDYQAVHEEIEQTTFSAQGTIKTADGQEIAFDLNLAMTRSYREETNVSARAGDGVRKDPLVINFGGTAAQLSSQRFDFDLNGDGTAESVPLLGSGSGYLALDLNGNGKVDSGKELFGPASGSGFADLAKYDQDHNGWIDENDPVFDKLRIWTQAADGGGALTSLKDRNVGALYLGSTGTAFELRGEGNRDLGAVRDTGLYLTEAGQAGTLQEVDLTV